MTFHLLQTEADQRRLRDIWRKVVNGKKVLVGQNMRGRDICQVPVSGEPKADWRGAATSEERTVLVRWIIENMSRPWEYL
jgi:hypothetical protein